MGSLIDITGVALAAIVIMFVLSGPRGRNRYYPLGFGILIACLAVVHGINTSEWAYYPVAAVALAKGLWDYSRWR